MSYQKKYFVEYQTLKQNSLLHTLELWQNTAELLVAEEVKGAQSPFIVELPELSHKFQVVRGTGASISLLSDTDMKFFAGLQHIDPQEFKVLHYVDGVLNWCGYLNADMQSEPYDIDFNYLISISANDGFSLMDRYRFLQSDESKYIGLKSKWELIQICLNKLALPYTDIRVKLATTFTGFSGDADKTILHESFVNCANFYDEDDLPMTLREVLDAILAPYGAFICQSGGSVYISDIHTMAGGGTIVFQRFNSSNYAYVSTVNFVAEKDVSAIGYFGTGHSIERSGGTNLQRVVYSPYQMKELVKEYIIGPYEFAVIPETFSDKNGYKYKTLTNHDYWNINVPADFEESFYQIGIIEYEHFVYARLPMITNNIPLLQLNMPELITSIKRSEYGLAYWDGYKIRHRYKDGVAILVTGKILVRTKLNPYNDGQNSVRTTRHSINYVAKIGDFYYNSSDDNWTTTPYFDNYLVTTKNAENISDKWVELGLNGNGLLITIGSSESEVLSGQLQFDIWSNTTIQPEGKTPLENNSILKETWIRNLKISIVNLDGSEVEDTDVEYIGKLNKLFAREGEEITLKVGSQNGFVDSAAIFKLNTGLYYSIPEWTRAGQTYKIEELLLNSLCSNYRMNYLTLLNMNLKNEFGIMNVITDSTYLSGKKFMVKSANIDFAEYRNTVNLVEISEDDLTIVKE